MSTYQLTWNIELDAASPAEAAAAALAIHRDVDSTATVFNVTTCTGEQFEIDAAVPIGPIRQTPRRLTVVGIYEDDHARFADTYEATDAADAIRQAREEAEERGAALLLVAGVVEGGSAVVDEGGYGEDDA